MARASRSAGRRRGKARRRRPRFSLRVLARLERALRRAAVSGGLRALGSAPRPVLIGFVLAACAAASLAVNWAYQAVRKPSELLFPVSERFYKSPAETWDSYGSLFRRHSTAVMAPELLAALAQVEASGNPVARTYWRFALTLEPFEIYRPASSSVGLYQMTNGTFAEARRYCIHDHRVAEQGKWNDWKACWFNALYTRTLATHAVELASAYLDRKVSVTLARTGIPDATLEQKQDLATVIHLCGAGAGARFARRGFRVAPGERCGAHDLGAYLSRVQEMKTRFARLAR